MGGMVLTCADERAVAMILMQRKQLSRKTTWLVQDPIVCRERCLLGPRWDFCYMVFFAFCFFFFLILEIITWLELHF